MTITPEKRARLDALMAKIREDWEAGLRCSCPEHRPWTGPVLTQEELDRRREAVLRHRFVEDDERPSVPAWATSSLPAWAFVYAIAAGFALALAAAIGGAP